MCAIRIQYLSVTRASELCIDEDDLLFCTPYTAVTHGNLVINAHIRLTSIILNGNSGPLNRRGCYGVTGCAKRNSQFI